MNVSSTESPASVSTLYRLPDRGLIGGVAAGLSAHLGFSVRRVRLFLLLLVAAGGLGVLLYGAFLLVLPTPPGSAGRRTKRLLLEWPVVGIGIIIVLVTDNRTVGLGWLFTAGTVALFGAGLIWRQASESDRERWRRLSTTSLNAGRRDRLGLARIVLGVVLVLTAAGFVLSKAGFSAVGAGILTVVVTVLGLALVTGPWWLRLITELSTERRERIRASERADLAAQVHDSVLQTLALIQRNADRPAEVARLARAQERQLRTMLYLPATTTGQFSAVLAEDVAEIEASYPITVDTVVVGEATMTEPLHALLAATRESIVNAAKHSGCAGVSVYAELTPEQASVFVRDRGVGFDPDEIPQDRQGIRGSVIGRLERHRGTARIVSSPGAGTEVQLVIGAGRGGTQQ